MKRFLTVLLSMLLLVPIAGSSAQDEPIRIGMITDLSGALSIYGVENTNGFQLGLLYEAGIDPLEYESLDDALADVTVADRPVELLVRDYGSESPASEPDDAVNAARELFEAEFVDIFVGPPRSGAAVAVQNLASPEELDIVLMSGPGATPDVTGANFNTNTFRVCRNALQDAIAISASDSLQEGDTYITLASDNAFGVGTAAGYDFAFPLAGIEPADDTILVPSDTVDFTPFLQQVAESEADHFVVIWAGGSSITLFQQIEELGIAANSNLIASTNSNDIVAAVPVAVGSQAYLIYNYTIPDNEINDWLVEKHIALFGTEPDLFSECGFASAQALYLGLEASGGDPLPDALVPALEGLSFEGPKGTYTIRESDHQALAPQYLIAFEGVEEVEIAEGITASLPQYSLVQEISPEDSAPPCFLPEAFADRCG